MPEDLLSQMMVARVPALIAPGVLIALAFFATWQGERERLHLLYWGFGCLLASVSAAIVPVDHVPHSAEPGVYALLALAVFAATGSLCAFLTGLGEYTGRPLRPSRTIAAWLGSMALLVCVSLLDLRFSMVGYSPGEAIGRQTNEFRAVEHTQELRERIFTELEASGHLSIDIPMRRRNGRNHQPVHGRDGEPARAAQRVIEEHGGWIRARSRPGQGASFVFNFGEPRAPELAERPLAAEERELAPVAPRSADA